MGQAGIFVWNGNYYALAVTERSGVEESGGMVRAGIAHYNTMGEVDRLLAAGLLHRLQILMNQTDGDSALPYGRGHSPDCALPDVASGEDARHTGLQ